MWEQSKLAATSLLSRQIITQAVSTVTPVVSVQAKESLLPRWFPIAICNLKERRFLITHPLTINSKHWPLLQLLLQQRFNTIPLLLLWNYHYVCTKGPLYPGKGGGSEEGKHLLILCLNQFLISWVYNCFLSLTATACFSFPTLGCFPQNQAPHCNTQEGRQSNRHCCLLGHFFNLPFPPLHFTHSKRHCRILSWPAKKKERGGN